ncbi:MAG: RNA polymerase sigma factor [Armatimonadetes bacterium]|nr:RNA polymerase sigma factor [Armatimonadota bacterium]
MNLLSDEELIARCKNGDRRAIDVLVVRYHGNLLDFALRQLSDRDAAADIAQAALIRAFESVASYNPVRATFRTWLYTIAMNLIREDFRKRLRRNEASLDIVMEIADEGVSIEDEVADHIESEELWSNVCRLREEHRSALLLRFRQGLSYDEIADVMGAPSGTVKSWVHYALRSLKKLLEPTNCGG